MEKPFCQETGFRQKLNCSLETTSEHLDGQSCPDPRTESQNSPSPGFVTFVCLTAILGLLSWLVVAKRKHPLH